MPEYIERENAIAWFMPYAHAGESIDADVVISDIKGMKAADVAPIRRGRWIEHEFEDESCFGIEYECSACGKFQYWDSKYCPNCGAKMDGKSNVPRTEGE